MTAASYKFDHEQKSYPTNKCFPARTFLHRRKEGAGHWLMAYRKAEEQKYTSLLQRTKKKDGGADTPRSNTLDGPFLLQLHSVDKPSELCFVNISEQKLNSVKPEDLKLFNNVAYIDASVNSLSLESFSSFVSLRELSLALNWLSNMTFNAADFPQLQVLDLSYNSLSADDIVSVGRLPCLKVLHLTGNQLHHLPPNLGSLNHDATRPKEEDTQFKALEVLILDDNKLSSAVFSSLRSLKRLKYLNLQGNNISEIPFLQLTGDSKPLQTSVEERDREERLASTESHLNTDENVKRAQEIFPKEPWVEICESSDLPFRELQFLNLADNKIAAEEALMAAAFFPKLQRLDIQSNPLTTQRRGDPPLLTYYLHERLGVTIKRKKTQEVGEFPLTVFSGTKWKLDERIPKVSKKPSLMAAPCPAEGGKSELTVKRTSEAEGTNKIQENTESFFVTQVQATEVPEDEFGFQADEDESAENKKRNKDDTIPEIFVYCEKLIDAKPNPDVVEPIGIQTAVRMLEHTLKNLNVYRDSKPKLDCIQTPCRERQKKIKELPALKPMRQPADRVHEMIKEIKESTTIRKIPLSSAINSTGVTKQEALSLLRDLKTKYAKVHERTMEHAASKESDRNTNRNGADTPPEPMKKAAIYPK